MQQDNISCTNLNVLKLDIDELLKKPSLDDFYIKYNITPKTFPCKNSLTSIQLNFLDTQQCDNMLENICIDTTGSTEPAKIRECIKKIKGNNPKVIKQENIADVSNTCIYNSLLNDSDIRANPTLFSSLIMSLSNNSINCDNVSANNISITSLSSCLINTTINQTSYFKQCNADKNLLSNSANIVNKCIMNSLINITSPTTITEIPLLSSLKPSLEPSLKPSLEPTLEPSLKSSSKPSLEPSLEPSLKSSSKPSLEPSSKPSLEPSLEPSKSSSKSSSTDSAKSDNTKLILILVIGSAAFLFFLSVISIIIILNRSNNKNRTFNNNY